jgi:hypothetical protein
VFLLDGHGDDEVMVMFAVMVASLVMVNMMLGFGFW